MAQVGNSIERIKPLNDRLVPIDLAVAEYDRTRPILEGRIKPDGIALNAVARYVGDFCVEPIYEEFDVAEMSFSWYVTARSLGEPVVALPIFPLRMPVLAFVLVGADSKDYAPQDLAGKRIGVPSYRFTVNLWLRGIFADYYGLAPDQVTWVTCGEEEGAGYVVPPGIKIEVAQGSTAEKLLERGEVDAILVPKMPSSFLEGGSRLRRLFKDAQAEMHHYVRRSGILPITHVLVMKQSLAEEQPWICESLFNAFAQSQRASDSFWLVSTKNLSMADAVFYLEQNRAAYGPNSWTHGFASNRLVIETFLRYAHDQGYTSRPLVPEELFPPNTLSL